MLAVLGLIDVVMISNLLVMVIVGGYETFVSRLNLQGHPDEPEWLSHVNASVLKIKLAMAIIGISSIHLLRTFIEAGGLAVGQDQLHRSRRDVADHHPHRVHSLGDRHRLRRQDLQRRSRRDRRSSTRIECGRGRAVDRCARRASVATCSNFESTRERFLAIGCRTVCLRLLLSALAFQRPPARAADAAFTQFIASLWPEAQAAGVSRATFDRETRGLEPDYKLPDLILPGRPATGAPSQAEFVQVPADYVKEAHHRAACGRGQQADAKTSRRTRSDRTAVSACRHGGARDLGPRDRLRPLCAAL